MLTRIRWLSRVLSASRLDSAGIAGVARVLCLCLCLGAIVVTAGGCAVVRSATASTTHTHGSVRAVGPRVLRSTSALPRGTFYLLAGPKSGWSNNVWQVAKSGRQVELTHNRPNYGIDGLVAAHAGIVVANAASDYDELARLTRHGMVAIPGGHADPAFMTAAGSVYFVEANPPEKLEVDKTFTSKPSLIFEQRETIGVVAQGPRSRIVFQSYPEFLPKGHHGPIFQVREVLGRHRARPIDAYIRDPQVPVWSPNAVGLSINSRKVASVPGIVLERGGHRRRMPRGWQSLTWSPNGRVLLLQKGRSLGLWNPKSKKGVQVVASTRGGSIVDAAVWLRSPARLPR